MDLRSKFGFRPPRFDRGERPPRRAPLPSEEEFARLREEMIEKQIRRRGLADARVLAALLEVPRHEFVPQELRAQAYEDKPLPIGENQTISQPYMVASMTAALGLTGTERVLEIGTGCGYQAAVLSRLAKEVYSIEVHPSLALAAQERLARLPAVAGLGYTNVHVHCGDGTLGLPECAPFDAILVTAAAPAVPAPLLEQLGEGGRLVIPVGHEDHQELRLIRKSGGQITSRVIEECRFVPLVGRHGWRAPFRND